MPLVAKVPSSKHRVGPILALHEWSKQKDLVRLVISVLHGQFNELEGGLDPADIQWGGVGVGEFI